MINSDFFFFNSPDLDETFLCFSVDIFSPLDRQEVTWIGKIIMIHLSAVKRGNKSWN